MGDCDSRSNTAAVSIVADRSVSENHYFLELFKTHHASERAMKECFIHSVLIWD